MVMNKVIMLLYLLNLNLHIQQLLMFFLLKIQDKNCRLGMHPLCFGQTENALLKPI